MVLNIEIIISGLSNKLGPYMLLNLTFIHGTIAEYASVNFSARYLLKYNYFLRITRLSLYKEFLIFFVVDQSPEIMNLFIFL